VREYGTVEHLPDMKKWAIRCEPHVSLRLKRVFSKVQPWQRGTFLLADTPENARDLDWFLSRYPMKVQHPERLAERKQLHCERTALVDDLLARRVAPPQLDLAVPLRDYQKIAASVVLNANQLLLADDVGLGKTASAIGIFTEPKTLPALVVTLTHLPTQWRNEITKFAPHLKVHIIKSSRPYDLTALPSRGKQLRIPTALPDVLIINYHKLSGWSETLSGIVRSLIFDECQELRHDGTAKYAAASDLAAVVSYRMGLSATPIYNYGGEFFNVMNCIAPGALGERNEFTTEWCNTYFQKPTIDDPKAFGSYMRESGLMLRRTRAEVGRELPPLTKIPHHVDVDEAALEKVSQSCAELARLILKQGEEFRGQKLRASEEFSNALRQATGIAKAPYVAEFVRMLLETGEQKVVLYAWHREVYSILLDRLKEFDPVMYTGTESANQKEEAKQQFTNGSSRVLLISLRAGAGLDGLQAVCRTVVFAELDWSPGVHEQCVGRVNRDGQQEPVMAYFMISETGADPVICDVLGLKKAQIEGVRNDSDDLVQKLQTDTGHIRKLAEAYLNGQRAGTDQGADERPLLRDDKPQGLLVRPAAPGVGQEDLRGSEQSES
jgi:SNF2 family DNA or RNA helicase